MTSKESCICGKYGSFEHLLLLFSFHMHLLYDLIRWPISSVQESCLNLQSLLTADSTVYIQQNHGKESLFCILSLSLSLTISLFLLSLSLPPPPLSLSLSLSCCVRIFLYHSLSSSCLSQLILPSPLPPASSHSLCFFGLLQEFCKHRFTAMHA